VEQRLAQAAHDREQQHDDQPLQHGPDPSGQSFAAGRRPASRLAMRMGRAG
jgi:hypothetical protein